jgi:hypothetical protein
VAISLFSFFCLMSKIDYIVHGTLYQYGLQFSFEWAIDYWIVYTVAFVAFSITVSLMYWLGSKKTTRDLKFSIALLVTVNILMISGLQDIMFYILWAGGLPPNNIIWWWIPWYNIVGTWTTSMQILSTSIGIATTILLWILLIHKPITTTSYDPKPLCNPQNKGDTS